MSVDAYLEISKGSQIKYEYNKEKNCLEVDRILHNTNSFPYNYGFIPNTLSPDGDALDMKTSNVVIAFIDGRMINLDNHQSRNYYKYKTKYGLE